MSRLFAEAALASGDLARAEAAVIWDGADAEAHYARAVVLADAGRTGESVAEFERAARLCPRDYFLWLELGRARDGAGDTAGARAAFAEAVALAPFYAQPRWQMGNLLFREGETDSAFAELRLASASDPKLFPAVVELAWAAAAGDAAMAVAWSRPAATSERLQLAQFLAARGMAGEALEVVRPVLTAAGFKGREPLVSALIAAAEYSAARAVWEEGRDGAADAEGHIYDGDFETSGVDDEAGFGWRAPRRADGVRLGLDLNAPFDGARSLLVEFAGESAPAAQLVSQLFAVRPRGRYRLRFAARTSGLNTGGEPAVYVVTPGAAPVTLARVPLAQAGTTGWKEYSVEFAASAESAARLYIRREGCKSGPCPAFGRLWLDGFSLEKL